MWTNIRHGVFVILGLLAFFLTWPHALDWMSKGGNILNPISFFHDAIRHGDTAAFLSLDMLFVWVTYMIWVVFDANRIGLGFKWGIFFVFFSYVGVSLSFPVYLVVRERFIDRKKSISDGTRQQLGH
jgi:hypothetical protein